MLKNLPQGLRKCAVAFFATIVLVVVCSSLRAAEYGRYDLKLLVKQNMPPGTGATFALSYLDKIVADLNQHAGNYPARFDSTGDAQRAQRDVNMLMGMLGAMAATGPVPAELLLRLGMLGSIGHNLDNPSGAAFAETHFGNLLRVNPMHVPGNYQYGKFLAGSAQPQKALPLLLFAKVNGVTEATYTLGMTYLSLGDKERALENLEAYQKAVPSDAQVGPLIEAIRAGRVEIRKSGG